MDKSKLPFRRKNYQWMIIGVATIILGFIIMSIDQNPHGFGFLGLTLGPMIVFGGFMVEIYAILIKPEEKNTK
jgi:uncharacterized membrane protein HdeD (DUF308 family)